MAMFTEKTQIRELSRELALPEGVTATMNSGILQVKGPLGVVKKNFNLIRVTVTAEGEQVKIKPFGTKKQDKAVLGTCESIIRHIIDGVTEGFTYKMKVAFAHFPVTVKIKGKEVQVENFYGERSPRIAEIVGDCKVFTQGDDMIIQGVSVEDVGHTVANIEQATKVKRKDQRVFLDGIYLYEKVRGQSA